MNKPTMSNDAKIITGLTLLAVAAVVLLMWFAGKTPDSERYLPTAVADAAGDEQHPVGELTNEQDPQSGEQDAAVTLVEFTDFQCPICETVFPLVEQLRDKYSTTELRLVYRLVPLWEIHGQALPAARAAVAANNQNRFREYAAALFEHQSELGEELYGQLADQLGLDLTRFNADRASDDTAWLASRARDYMTKRGWDLATPTIIINDQPYTGQRTVEAMSAAIDALLKP